jgi:hypothetical protein
MVTHFTSIQALTAMAEAAVSDGGPLFPNLLQIRMESTTSTPVEDVTLLGIFLSPATLIFHATGVFANSLTNQSFLGSLAHRCPNLEDAFFTSNIKLPLLSLKESFSDLHRLRALELAIDSAEAMAALSSLPSLQTLTVLIAGSNNDSSTAQASGGFVSLTKFICNTDGDLSPCLGAIRTLTKVAPLSCLRLSSRIPSPVQTIAGIIELLPTYVNNETLVELSIQERFEDQDSVHVVRLDGATELLEDPFHLSLLGGFRALQYLSIETTLPISIGMQALRPLEHVNLHTLVIGFFSDAVSGEYKPKIRLKDLVEILGMFPSLSCLGLPIDATVVPRSSRRPGRGLVHKPSFSLSVGALPVYDVQDVAAFLSDMFAQRCIIERSEWVFQWDGAMTIDNPYNTTWRKVDDLIPFLIGIRKQERKSALLGFSETDEE